MRIGLSHRRQLQNVPLTHIGTVGAIPQLRISIQRLSRRTIYYMDDMAYLMTAPTSCEKRYVLSVSGVMRLESAVVPGDAERRFSTSRDIIVTDILWNAAVSSENLLSRSASADEHTYA